MSETTTENNESTEDTQVQETDSENTEDAGKAGQEAAKYRRRLREAEAERDALTTRLEQLQRAEVERLAEQHIAKGSGLWAATELADVLDEDGNIDPAKVTAAARAAREQLGLSQSRHGGKSPMAGRAPSLEDARKSFTAAFGPGND